MSKYHLIKKTELTEDFKNKLRERIYKEVNDFFIGAKYGLPVRIGTIRVGILIPKQQIAEFMYNEAIKQIEEQTDPDKQHAADIAKRGIFE